MKETTYHVSLMYIDCEGSESIVQHNKQILIGNLNISRENKLRSHSPRGLNIEKTKQFLLKKSN